MGKVELVPATAADCESAAIALYGKVTAIPVRIAAFAGKLDGRVLGVGGVAFYPNGARVAFCDVGDEGRRHKIALHKAALMTIQLARALRVRRLLVTVNGMHEKTPRWIERLGFVRMEMGKEAAYVLDL